MYHNRNLSYVLYSQALIKCSVHSLQRLDCLFLSSLVLIEYVLDTYVMYDDDVHLTFQIRFFTNFFRLFFVASQCFTRLLVIDFEHDDFFKMTSRCQYVFLRILFRVDISRLFYIFFRYHVLYYLNFLLLDHLNHYLQLFS